MKLYLTETQIVDFYKKCEKGLRLDWIKNYARVIPDKFVEVKKKLDDLKIFDNYVILHYDPDLKSFKETEAEIEEKKRPKDPILFGVMQDSRKLYYIGDWIDEYCDLTLDKVLEVLETDNAKEIETNIRIENLL